MASVVDYWVTIATVEFLDFHYVAGSGLGTLIGGITNFSIGRHWVFQSSEEEARAQLFRYILVWVGYLMITTSGVYLLTHHTRISYIISKLVVSLFMAIMYNYPLQKRFVFRRRA